MARLVAATCPKCGAGVRLDPDHEFVTCGYCGVSSFIQTRRRPPTEQVIQAHHPVIHLENTARRVSGCISAVISISVLGIIGVGLSALFAGGLPGLALKYLGSDAGMPIPISVPQIGSIFKPPVVPVEEDLFGNPSIVKSKLEERLGAPVRIKEMVLYPTYARAVAQDPKVKHHLDSYFYRYGTLQEPEPERLGSDKTNLDKLLFALDEIDFARVPALLRSAARDLAIEQGSVTHVIIERGGFGTKAPCVRVYVNGPRDSGYVEYDARGKRLRVMK